MWNVQQSHITLYKQVLRIIFIIYIVNTQNAQVFSNTFMNAVFDNGIQKYFLVYCYCYYILLSIIQNYTPIYISFVILCYVYLLFSSNIIICETEKCKQKIILFLFFLSFIIPSLYTQLQQHQIISCMIRTCQYYYYYTYIIHHLFWITHPPLQLSRPKDQAL